MAIYGVVVGTFGAFENLGGDLRRRLPANDDHAAPDLVGRSDRFFPAEKQFFLAHWFESLGGKSKGK